MQYISIRFDRGVSRDKRRAVLENLVQWPEIEKASELNPNSTHPEISRMANVYVAEGTDPGKLVERLNDIAEIESASEPPKRRLV